MGIKSRIIEQLKRFAVPLVFTGVFMVYFLSKVSYVTDSRWVLQTSWSINHHGNTQLDEFKPLIEQNNYYAIDNSNGHLYYSFPPGTSLLCSPILATMEQVAKRIFFFDIHNLLTGPYQGGMEIFLASLFAMLTSFFVYLVLRQWKIEPWLIWMMVFAFAFGTSAWSVASRGLFAHGPSMLFLVAGIWSLNKAQEKIGWLWGAGFLFAYAYIIRPTNSIPLAIFTGYVLWQYRLASWRFLASALPVVLLFFIYNYSIYGHLLSPYYSPSHVGKEHHLLSGLAGNLFSPNRGLFVYSPFIILLVPVLYIMGKRKTLSVLQTTILSAILLHILLISYFDNWYAGWCFGPRYFTDIMPFLILLLSVGLQTTFSSGTDNQKKWAINSFILLTAASLWINSQGANNDKTFEWNYKPNNIDDHRERIWDWHDIQFLR